MAKDSCPNQAKNAKFCSCSYPGCSRHGLCCECLQFHLRAKELPACCFPPDVERSYDRSFQAFVKAHRDLIET